jgi:hypothetical protein
VTSMRPT